MWKDQTDQQRQRVAGKISRLLLEIPRERLRSDLELRLHGKMRSDPRLPRNIRSRIPRLLEIDAAGYASSGDDELDNLEAAVDELLEQRAQTRPGDSLPSEPPA